MDCAGRLPRVLVISVFILRKQDCTINRRLIGAVITNRLHMPFVTLKEWFRERSCGMECSLWRQVNISGVQIFTFMFDFLFDFRSRPKQNYVNVP